MEFKKITYERYKEIAENFLEKHNFRKGIIPTDIEMLIKKSGIVIVAFDGLKKDYSVKGLVAKDVKNDGPVKIFIDARHYEEDEFEYKFTLAEELGHILLHFDFYDRVHTVDDYIKISNSINDDDYRRFEQQARNIASFLLLPQKEFNEYVIGWIEKNIEKLIGFNYESPENFSEIISRALSRDIVLSQHVISRTIINRYPERVIDIIVDKFGNALKL